MGNPFGSDDKDKKPDGVSTYPADQHDLQSYVDASRQLSQLSAPVLLNSSNPNERIFIAAFDGTGNDLSKDKKDGGMTNVASMADSLSTQFPEATDPIRVGYVKGPGTQENFFTRTIDGARGYTYEPRIEEMYRQFTEQSAIWLAENPNAQIRVVGVGFSRGAEQAAGFTRLVEERGIQDPTGVQVRGNERIYTQPPLVPPGQVVQAVGLFDPVGTGVPRDHDRRLPPSVISGFQITAEDERRNQFKSTNIIDPGFHENNRFLNVTVGGAHSNIGGSYQLNGLGVRSGNLMVDYLNSLSDKPYLQRSPVPTDPAMNVVHRSEEHLFIYGTKDFERNNGRVRIEEVAPKNVARTGADVTNKEPHNPNTAQQFNYRNVPVAPEASMTTPTKPGDQQGADWNPTNPLHPDHKLFLQSTEAVRRLETSLGRAFDENSERMAAGLTFKAKEDRLSGIGNAELSGATTTLRAGENIIAYLGARNDPAHDRTHMKTQDAIALSVPEWFRKIEDLNFKFDKNQQVSQNIALTPGLEAGQPNLGQEPKQHTLTRNA